MSHSVCHKYIPLFFIVFLFLSVNLLAKKFFNLG